MTDGTEQQPVVRERIGRHAWVRSAALVVGGLVAGGILAGTITAGAVTTDDTSTPTSSSSTAEGVPGEGAGGGGPGAPAGNGDPSQPQRPDEQLLTGDTATKVTDVVEAEYPDATIQRVETDSDGVYEAHIVSADGQQLIVHVGEDFSISGTQRFGR